MTPRTKPNLTYPEMVIYELPPARHGSRPTETSQPKTEAASSSVFSRNSASARWAIHSRKSRPWLRAMQGMRNGMNRVWGIPEERKLLDGWFIGVVSAGVKALKNLRPAISRKRPVRWEKHRLDSTGIVAVWPFQGEQPSKLNQHPNRIQRSTKITF